MKTDFDVIVIGAGHAGVEAACTLSKLNKKVLLLSLSLNAVAFMACNPNIGGTAKGHLVREIDALGGEMGIIADKATIQTKMLNRGNGPAVHSLRAQVDKELFHTLQKQCVESLAGVVLQEAEVKDIIVEDGVVKGVTTTLGARFNAPAVIVATGVYLGAKIIIGEYREACGPSGYKRAEHLTKSLQSLGFEIQRFKTGTPARILRSSVGFSKMEAQYGEYGIPKFSYMTDYEVANSEVCYLTYTNERTHKIILDNLDRAPMYNGSIKGTGARYCPSIEDKVVRFRDKDRHQIFIEPEGVGTEEMYVQGLSTSLPYDVQEKMIRSIKGLENVVITRYGYAIEYDCIDPLTLLPTLAAKHIEGLYMAGQVNGTSGYEEAAAQGLVAAVNAAHFLDNKEPFILKRSRAYIGVLIDDLVTKGTSEPYRMMTSRAEHRLYLRQDNADARLTETGYRLGLVGEERFARFKQKQKLKEEIKHSLKASLSPSLINPYAEEHNKSSVSSGCSGEALLRRSDYCFSDLVALQPEYANYDAELLSEVEIEIKYAGYIKKQQKEIAELQKMEDKKLPSDICYKDIDGLRLEARQKLDKIKPLTLAQASRISGVNPSDITVLIVHLHKQKQVNS